MNQLSLLPKKGAATSILLLGAHSDDIEIGCGGTVLQLLASSSQLEITWVVLSGSPARKKEAEKSFKAMVAGANANFIHRAFKDGFFPFEGAKIKAFFESLKSSVEPDVIFTHWGGDAHQDHRFVSEMTWNTFRSQLIFEYEIPKYDGDLGRPNAFVPLKEQFGEKKVAHLMRSFASQSSKDWYSAETFMGLMRLRGMESRSASGLAEAFHCRKLSINI